MTVLKPKRGAKLELIGRTRQTRSSYKTPNFPAELPHEMRREWARVCGNLFKEGLWHDDRLPVVAAYLHNIYIFRQAARDQAENPLFDERGYPRPSIMAGQKAMTAALAAAKALGLTVSPALITAQAREVPQAVADEGPWRKLGSSK